LIEFTGQFAA